MKRKTANRRPVRRNTKRNTKKGLKNRMKKSSKKYTTGKKHGSMRKNIKRVSLKNFSTAHKKYVDHHHHRALHNGPRSLHGGKKSKKSGYSKQMKGGMVSSPASGPVGYSWQGGNEATWPGVVASHGTNTNGIAMSNHFAVSPNGIVVGGIDLARSTSDDNIITPPMNGGRKARIGGIGGKKQKGGFFQEIVNLGRGVQDGINGGYFNLIGKQQPISQNPYPTEQPLSTSGKSTYIGGIPSDIEQIYINANNDAAKV